MSREKKSMREESEFMRKGEKYLMVIKFWVLFIVERSWYKSLFYIIEF